MSTINYNSSQIYGRTDQSAELIPMRLNPDGSLPTNADVNSIQTVQSLQHYHILRGEAFSISQYWVNITNTSFVSVLIRAAQQMALIFHAASGGEVLLRTYQNPIFSVAGAVIPVRNRNSAFSGSNSTALFNDSPTVSDKGTEIFIALSPGGSGLFAGGGQTGALGSPLVLNVGDTYLFEIENTSGGNVNASLNAGWIEPS